MTDTINTRVQSLVAKDIMTPQIKAVPQNWTMQKFAKFLADNDLSGSPVADENGELVGIATLKDVSEFHFNSVESQYEKEMDAEERKESRRLRMMIFEGLAKVPVEVSDIMTPILFSVNENDSVETIAKLMMAEHLHRVFVKSAGEVCGIITTYDLLKIIADQ